MSNFTKFLVISHVMHKQNTAGQIGGYGPYVREMNLWLKQVGQLMVVAPIEKAEFSPIDLAYEHPNITFLPVPAIDFTSIRKAVASTMLLPFICCRIFGAMCQADHIHLRCPGNMGLLGSIVQILFPSKKKTAKYAGNWDPAMCKVKSYTWQRSIIANEKLSRNMTVLAYGKWPNQSRNVLPFFTASYRNDEITPTPARDLDGKRIKCLYCGFLMPEKKPMKSIQVVEKLRNEGLDIELTLLGDGPEHGKLLAYINEHHLESCVFLAGNISVSEVKNHMQRSHFLTFYGHDSEGWPKAVAESMFWGCVPLVRSVSCTRYMLGDGERGTIVDDTVDSMAAAIKSYLAAPAHYKRTAEKAMQWSRQYTLEKFEAEIAKLI
jgi:glycosyltransferase involved in cell wall biosynthesis